MKAAGIFTAMLAVRASLTAVTATGAAIRPPACNATTETAAACASPRPMIAAPAKAPDVPSQGGPTPG